MPGLNISDINGVLLELDKIIAQCERDGSREAYFAVLYRQMTEAVRNGITDGFFEDGIRMEKLDVIFAKRYINAWHCYRNGSPCSLSWRTAFDACKKNDLTVVQHLVLGVNTHINLDLSIAAAETAPGQDIFKMQADYDRINDIIATTANNLQIRLEKIWWPMKLLTRIGNDRHKAVINFSILKARQTAWASAAAMALAEGPAEENYVTGLDNTVTAIANGIINPGIWAASLLKIVRWSEEKDVGKIITLLK
jgi:hypothetical protein